MKCALNLFILLLTPFLLSSCSLYQSEGREFLEKQAFQFSNQGLSIAIVQQKDNCVQTDGLAVDFFETGDWERVATSFNPDYSMFEDQDPNLHSMVVAYKPLLQSDLYVCEYLYDSEEDLHNNQKEDLQQALETVLNMLN